MTTTNRPPIVTFGRAPSIESRALDALAELAQAARGQRQARPTAAAILRLDDALEQADAVLAEAREAPPRASMYGVEAGTAR